VTQFNWRAAALVAAVAVGSASLFVRAADEAKPAGDAPKTAAKTAEGEKKEAKKPAKLTKPWSQLTTLSEDQSSKIRDIHAKALAETKAIEEKEHADILALLTDAQKSELSSQVDAEAAAKKAAAPKKEKTAAKEGDAAKPAPATKAP
jgi:hypothetical protein